MWPKGLYLRVTGPLTWKGVVCAVVLFAVIAFAVLLFLKWQYASGVSVTLQNDSGKPIQDVVLSYTGGRTCLPYLAEGSRVTTRINPSGESHLEVDWVDPGGNAYHRVVDCYFERNYSGTLDITIGPAGRITYVDSIEGPYEKPFQLVEDVINTLSLPPFLVCW
ncbi:hypothetical protein [Thermogutta sp.]|uniref:hypothetical protein n=1 Tax=Thermogutta sp. TaxID=1962930 RepID=UPI00268ED930